MTRTALKLVADNPPPYVNVSDQLRMDIRKRDWRAVAEYVGDEVELVERSKRRWM